MQKKTFTLALSAVALAALSVALATPALAHRCTPDQQALAEELYGQVATACPCDGQWKNHGRYVSCVATTSNKLFKQHPEIARSCKRIGRKCAARSTCGKEGAVRCCLGRDHACLDDPIPGDLNPEGTCDSKDAGACDTNADCTEYRCKISRHPERCDARGGIDIGPGSCCGGCSQLPSPTTTLP
jgi:hypothetical protein